MFKGTTISMVMAVDSAKQMFHANQVSQKNYQNVDRSIEYAVKSKKTVAITAFFMVA